MNREELFQKLCGILLGFIMGALLLFVAVTMGGCSKRVVYVPQTSEVSKADTVRQIAVRVDSVWLRDSVYVERASGVTGDTIRIEHYRDRVQERLRVDTVYKARVDSVAVREPYPVEVVKEVNKVKGWQWALMAVGIVALMSVLLYVLYRYHRRYKERFGGFDC